MEYVGLISSGMLLIAVKASFAVNCQASIGLISNCRLSIRHLKERRHQISSENQNLLPRHEGLQRRFLA